MRLEIVTVCGQVCVCHRLRSSKFLGCTDDCTNRFTLFDRRVIFNSFVYLSRPVAPICLRCVKSQCISFRTCIICFNGWMVDRTFCLVTYCNTNSSNYNLLLTSRERTKILSRKKLTRKLLLKSILTP